MYRVELKVSFPSSYSITTFMFLMYRVELKVPSLSISKKTSLPSFLMYRVELKAQTAKVFVQRHGKFLMYRVELKVT